MDIHRNIRGIVVTENPITLFALYSEIPSIRPAPAERGWMDRTPQKYAYRCLPLNIANGIGWQILNEIEFEAIWNGDESKSGISIMTRGEGKHHLAPISHFGSGILTFHIQGIFRTKPGVPLFVSGATNEPIHGLYPLSGIVETSWSPYTFTMNWKFTAPHVPVVFPKGAPICQIFPVDLGLIEGATAEIRHVSEEEGLSEAHNAWATSRSEFNAKLESLDPEAAKQGWQKRYFQGVGPNGERADVHRTKLKAPEFIDKRKG